LKKNMSLIREANQSDAKNLAELAEEIASSDWMTLVAKESGNLIAYAQLRFRQPPACVSAESPGEIHRIHVDNTWHGQGIAQELMATCLEKMQAQGKDVVWLGVWEHNHRAIAFYKKYGFEQVGDHEFVFGSESQRDVIMVRGV
jgi:ribosomal protein S18 acetylase RimI-like enzyme